MDAFDKRAIFYVLLIFIIISFFMFFYWDGIDYWNGIYEDAQESINESQCRLSSMESNDSYYYSFIWVRIDSTLISIHEKPHYYRYFLHIEIDSAWLPCFSGYDTIVYVKKYENHSDTTKVALEDL